MFRFSLLACTIAMPWQGYIVTMPPLPVSPPTEGLSTGRSPESALASRRGAVASDCRCQADAQGTPSLERRSFREALALAASSRTLFQLPGIVRVLASVCRRLHSRLRSAAAGQVRISTTSATATQAGVCNDSPRLSEE